MLSVLVVNWNTKDLLLACLNSLLRFPSDEPMEILVVDNASTDGSAQAVDGMLEGRPNLHLIKATQNSGYARGNNIAFERASGEWLLTLNPDTEVFQDTLQTAIDTLKRRPREGALGARQISPDGTTQGSIRGFPTLTGILASILRLRKWDTYTLPDFEYETEQLAPQPMGTFLLFRREALAAIGDPRHPFDEDFPIFFNEVDLLYRLQKAGWTCVYDPAVRVLHHGGESTKQVRPKMIWESHRSLIRYLKKHSLRWWNAPVFAVAALVVWLGAFVRARTYDVGFRP